MQISYVQIEPHPETKNLYNDDWKWQLILKELPPFYTKQNA